MKRSITNFLAVASILAAAGPSSAVGISNSQAGKDTALIDPAATIEARGLMRYLSSIYKKHVLSGHQVSYSMATANEELAKIQSWTGKTPAVRGYDFMDVINSWGAPHATEGLAWGKSGGIVTLNWHWRLGGKDFYSPAYHAGGTSFPAGDPATNATINADLKKLGDELQKFADAKIPVLWRPLHEPPGNWFWWHDGGPDQFKKLWIHMYDYLVNTRNLHNLIWVYSSSDGGTSNAAWYPGNKYVDIVGVDGYGEQWQNYWNGLYSLTGNGQKMAAMTENKKFPSWNASYPYLWVISWNNEIFNSLGSGDFKAVYGNPNTINLEDLPTYKAALTWDAMIDTVEGPVCLATPSDLRVSNTATILPNVVDLAKIFRDTVDGTNLKWAAVVQGSDSIKAQVSPAGKVDLSIAKGTVARVLVTVSATNRRGATTSTKFEVVVKDFANGNLARFQDVAVSSDDGTTAGADAVTDGDTATRWSSVYQDDQWVRIDLDTVRNVDSVVLRWEAAFATAYDIEVATDTGAWTLAKSVTAGVGGVETIGFPSKSARWIRLVGRSRATKYGISLWEFEVYGDNSISGTRPARCGVHPLVVRQSVGGPILRIAGSGGADVEIRDLRGVLVRKWSGVPAGDLEIRGLARGIYEIVVRGDSKLERGRFLSP